MLDRYSRPDVGGVPKDQATLIREVASTFVQLARDEGLVQPYKYLAKGFSDFNTYDPEAPYLHLAEAVDATFREAVDRLLLNPNNQRYADEYNHITGNARTGMHIVASVLEMVPLKHEQQYPNEDPTAQELGDIARRSLWFPIKVAGNGVDVLDPLLNLYLDPTREGGTEVGILRNWVIPEPGRLAQFVIEDSIGGRRLMPRDWHRIHEDKVNRQKELGHYRKDAHCPALDVRTDEGDFVIPAAAKVMIAEATKWHYVHTIREVRLNTPKAKAEREASRLLQELSTKQGQGKRALWLVLDGEENSAGRMAFIYRFFLSRNSFIASQQTTGENTELVYQAIRQSDFPGAQDTVVIVLGDEQEGNPYRRRIDAEVAERIVQISRANGWPLPYFIGNSRFLEKNELLGKAFPDYYLGDLEYLGNVISAVETKLP